MTKKCVLVVEDDFELQEAVAETLKLAGFKVRTANNGIEALDVLSRSEVDMVVSDVNMDGMDGIELLENIRGRHGQLPVLMVTAYADVDKAVSAMRLGAVDFMIKPFEPTALIETVRQQAGDQTGVQPVVVDPVSRKLYLLAKKVAVADSTVLLLGESGVGKEVISRFIHEESPRASKPFVAINCAAIPENMLEATLFGHEKGAYTGAVNAREGKFEQADGGTLLLDEISEMDLGLQAKLLRVLQEREVERLGGKTVRKVDVRVIATTNRNLVEYVQAGKFREDLYYRISVFPLAIEPLRHRRGDILPLAEQMLENYCRRMNRPIAEFDEAAAQALKDYNWPGNVRELENAVQRSLILQPGQLVGESDLFLDPMLNAGQPLPAVAAPGTSATVTSEDPEQDGNLEENLKHKEFQLIIDVLRKEGGSRSKTAEQLGISARTLRYKLARMRDCGIDINAELAVG
jgi:two-component system response regulator FlrC